jgi:hypothetical protein
MSQNVTDDEKLLYKFTPEEQAIVVKRWSAYVQSLEVIAELHGLDALGLPLNVSLQKAGFVAPPGVEIKQGAQKREK